MSYLIGCAGCGEKTEAGLWIETATGQNRPKNHYQCPKCCSAFSRECLPSTFIEIEGEKMLVPGKIIIKSIEPVHSYGDNIILFKGKL